MKPLQILGGEENYGRLEAKTTIKKEQIGKNKKTKQKNKINEKQQQKTTKNTNKINK